jgi:hypothetical protein
VRAASGTVVAEALGRAPAHTEISDPFAQPPGMATTRWAPPAKVDPRLAASAPGGIGVDETMDDQQSAPQRSRTIALVQQGPVSGGPSSAPASGGTPGTPAVAAVTARGADLETAPPYSRASQTPAPVSRSPSGVDATLIGDDAVAPAAAAPRPAGGVRGARGVLVAVVCFLVGALGMIAIAWTAWRPMAARTAESSPGTADRAHDVVAAAAKAPADPIEPPQALPPLDPLPAQRPGASPNTVPASPNGSPAPAGAVRIAVDASSARPGVGQPVDFTARVVSGKVTRMDGAHFLIGGPGIAPGTEISAADDGTGVYRTTFTFLEAGRFEVAFAARADKTAVRSARVVLVGDANAGPPPPAAAPPAPPPGAADESRPPANASATGGANGKWL